MGIIGRFDLDIVMCIDATGGNVELVEHIKDNALDFCCKIGSAMVDAGKDLDKFRIKVIAFRDYMFDDEPMTESEFFEIPEQVGECADFIHGIQPTGGGDRPENALEAIALALKSEWNNTNRTGRHVVLVFTDAPALPIREREGCPGYPTGMPADLDELRMWVEKKGEIPGGSFAVNKARIVLFAPEEYPWEEISTWQRVAYITDKAAFLNENNLRFTIEEICRGW